MKRITLIIILFIISLITIGQMEIYSHEKAHEAFSGYAGCTNSTLKMSFLSGEFECHSYENRSCSLREEEVILDGINEIVSYNSQRDYLIFASMFAIMILLVYKDGTSLN